MSFEVGAFLAPSIPMPQSTPMNGALNRASSHRCRSTPIAHRSRVAGLEHPFPEKCVFEVDEREGMLRFQGRGLGHSVGLCQYGAMARAKAGQDAETILRYYFPGLVLTRLPRVLAFAI